MKKLINKFIEWIIRKISLNIPYDLAPDDESGPDHDNSCMDISKKNDQ